MHPEMIRALAEQRRRDIAASFRRHKPRRTLRSLYRSNPAGEPAGRARCKGRPPSSLSR